MPPELSVVIPTYNRINILKETLEGLFNQSLDKQRFEIIVVDDGSDDGTTDMIIELRGKARYNLRIYWQEHSLAGSARNLGIQEADTNIILLMDSDIIPTPKLLEHHLKLHQKYPEPEAGVFGRVITGEKAIDLCDPDNRRLSPIGTTKNGDPLLDAGYLTTQNISLKRKFLIQAGLFTPGLPCLQDMDLAFRLKEKGLKLIYCPEAIGIHTQPLDTLEKVVSSGKKYGRTLAEWFGRIPNFQKEIANFGGRFDGGWNHFIHHPGHYLKDAVRRLIINKYTIDLILRAASRITITKPPKNILVRCCREIWAYYYRHEFYAWRKHFLGKKVNHSA